MQGHWPLKTLAMQRIPQNMHTNSAVPGESIGAGAEGQDGREGEWGARGERPQEQGARLLGGLARILQRKLPLWRLFTDNVFLFPPSSHKTCSAPESFQHEASSMLFERA